MGWVMEKDPEGGSGTPGLMIITTHELYRIYREGEIASNNSVSSGWADINGVLSILWCIIYENFVLGYKCMVTIVITHKY